MKQCINYIMSYKKQRFYYKTPQIQKRGGD
jgi:hypothetical protein